MKKIKHVVLLTIMLTVVVGFSSCKKEKGEKIPFTTIAKGEKAGIPEQSTIIHTQEEWKELGIAMHSDFDEIEIDFETHKIIVVIDEVRPCVGFSITIVRVTEYLNKIVVSIDLTTPLGPCLSALTQPYHIVKIPKTIKKIQFQYHKKQLTKNETQ